jgi:hypothetical protein
MEMQAGEADRDCSRLGQSPAGRRKPCHRLAHKLGPFQASRLEHMGHLRSLDFGNGE